MPEDRWQRRETVATDEGDIDVSTVELPLSHGPDRNQDYETCLFGDFGSRVVGRYETRTEAEDGHEAAIELLDAGAFEIITERMGIELDERIGADPREADNS